jgi:phosphate/sulfate permease
MKKAIKEYWQLAVALLVIVITILVMCCSCSTPREIEHVYHHDTVYSNSVVHDSVDRWHTHYEFVRGDTLHVIDTFWRDRWHVAHDTAYKTVVEVQTREVEKIVEKKVYVWWPCWVVLGIAIALGLWWLVEHTINNIAKKEGEQ